MATNPFSPDRRLLIFCSTISSRWWTGGNRQSSDLTFQNGPSSASPFEGPTRSPTRRWEAPPYRQDFFISTTEIQVGQEDRFRNGIAQEEIKDDLGGLFPSPLPPSFDKNKSELFYESSIRWTEIIFFSNRLMSFVVFCQTGRPPDHVASSEEG